MLRTPELKPYIIYIKAPPFERLKETRHRAYARSTFDETSSRSFTVSFNLLKAQKLSSASPKKFKSFRNCFASSFCHCARTRHDSPGIIGAERAKRAERLIPKFSGAKIFELVSKNDATIYTHYKD